MKWVAGYLAAFCVLLLIIAQSIFIPSFFMPFFDSHYQRRNIAADVGVEHGELMRITEQLLLYMRGNRDDLVIYAQFTDGQTRQFFTDHVEIIHMVDVMDLYVLGFQIRNIAFFTLIFIILAMALFKVPILLVMARCCREVIVVFLLLLIILTALIAWDFDSAFVMFHLIFFDNEYWLLDPTYSYLLRMVPINFFIEVSIFIGGLLLLFCAALITASSIYLWPRNDTQTVARFR